MSRALDCLYAGLTEVDGLEVIAREDIDLEIIPAEHAEMRQVVSWAVDRFFESGQLKAPSRAALLATWGEVIDGCGVELLAEDEEYDNVEWAIDDLRSRYVHHQFQQMMMDAGRAMAEAAPDQRVEVLAEQVAILQDLALQVQSRANQQEGLAGIRDSLARYRSRAQEGHQTLGMTFGLPPVDRHLYGIHPGELCVFAAGSATGKSWMQAATLLNEWRLGRKSVLYTLENSVEMTYDRIITLGSGVDARAYQRGELHPTEMGRLERWVDQHEEGMRDMVLVVMPPVGGRLASSMVRHAQTLGAESLLVDQLTFMEHSNPSRKAKHEVVGDIMHELKTMISSGRHRMSCLLTHQINREGIKAAEKTGQLEMTMLADSSETERTADQVLGLYQSSEMRLATRALLQVLKARREDLAAWDLVWRPANGMIQVTGEAVLS